MIDNHLQRQQREKHMLLTVQVSKKEAQQQLTPGAKVVQSTQIAVTGPARVLVRAKNYNEKETGTRARIRDQSVSPRPRRDSSVGKGKSAGKRQLNGINSSGR